jgi:lipopolysaccharide transport system ATP-binding protein
MYVRLAFAVAAHLDPEILIVDEVLAVGDAEFQNRCLGKMKQISSSSGRTVLFVSHNMAAVRSLCSRGVLLKNGRVELLDSAESVVNTYLTADHAQRSATLRFDRPPGARLWMVGAALQVDGVPSSTAPMGANLALSIAFDAETPTRHPRFGYLLQTDSGERLLNSNNRFQRSPSFDEPVRKGEILCDLGIPPLMPGRYSFSLWLGDLGGDHHIEIESLSFEVIERDLWGLGQLPPAQSLMWWPTKYSLHVGSRSEFISLAAADET